MSVQVRVDWNRLFIGVVIVIGAVIGLVFLATPGPSSDRRGVPGRPPGPDGPMHSDVSGPDRPTRPASPPRALPARPPTIDWHYADPAWDVEVRHAARADGIRVMVLDSDAPDEVQQRAAPEGRVWLIVAVTWSYKGTPSPAGLRIDFGDLRLVPTGGAAERVVSARPAGQAFFKVFERRAFPPIALEAGDVKPDYELLFSVPAGEPRAEAYVVRGADVERP